MSFCLIEIQPGIGLAASARHRKTIARNTAGKKSRLYQILTFERRATKAIGENSNAYQRKKR
jgi:hypothetical protein